MPNLDAGPNFANGDDATAEVFNDRFEKIEDWANDSIASVLLGQATPGQIIVVGNDGKPAYVTPSGDASIGSDGSISIPQQSKDYVADATVRTTTAGSFQALGSNVKCTIQVASTADIVWLLYRAEWRSQGSSSAQASALAAIYVDGSALLGVAQNTFRTGTFDYVPLVSGAVAPSTMPSGLASSDPPALSNLGDEIPYVQGLSSHPVAPWSPVPISGLSAGSHDIEVRFHANSNGTLSVRNRQQWCWVQEF